MNWIGIYVIIYSKKNNNLFLDVDKSVRVNEWNVPNPNKYFHYFFAIGKDKMLMQFKYFNIHI